METRNKFEVIFNAFWHYQLKVTNLKCGTDIDHHENGHNKSWVWIQFVGKLIVLQACKLLVSLEEGGTGPSRRI